MRIKASKKRESESRGDDAYCVQLYSRRASLVQEFCLDKRENDVSDLEPAENPLHRALTPSRV